MRVDNSISVITNNGITMCNRNSYKFTIGGDYFVRTVTETSENHIKRDRNSKSNSITFSLFFSKRNSIMSYKSNIVVNLYLYWYMPRRGYLKFIFMSVPA